jgi:acyl-CoA-dependent ceramide synthase
MTGLSSSNAPLSASPDELKQRFALKEEQSSSLLNQNNLANDDHDHDNDNELNKKKHLDNLNEIAKSEKLDRSTINLSILFFITLFLGSKYGSPIFKKFYTLSYKYPNTNYYDIGLDDIYFATFWVINLLFLRSYLIVYVFKPCARLAGIKKFRAIQRFIEQSWSIFYYSLSWGYGFYLYSKSNYFFNCYNIYANWPHDKLSPEFKFYYLVQTASWFQQFVVLHLEARRKDHLQMFAHHIITILLCTGSYYFYFTRIGHIILLLMDIVDVLLSTAKILKYCGFQQSCDIMFIIFMLSWVVLRHGVYIYVLIFTWTKARLIMNADCSKFLPGQFVKICYTDFQIDIFLLLLTFLQVITMIWMFMILRVAIRVIRGNSADDIRSDSE